MSEIEIKFDKPKITEEMHFEKEWFAEAKNQTPETLMRFINHVLNDYIHDYGTIVHAVSACAIAAAWAADEKAGLTGFQAGFVMWDFIRQWSYPSNRCGLKIVNYDNLLYPQYKDKFEKTIPKNTWERVQDVASKELEGLEGIESDWVVDHWKSIVNGEVPFGYKVVDD